MKITPEGITLIKSRESCRLEAYKCPAGIWTIGYGHTGPDVHEGRAILQDEAEALLAADLATFDSGVARICPAGTDCQHSAMVSLAYNIGLGKFGKSSVARLHNAERYAEAAQAFGMWNKAGGRVLSGLVSRRAAEAALYLEDTPHENAPTAEGEKPMAESRTMNGQAIAGAATVASGGAGAISKIDLHTDSFQQAQDTLSGLAPYYSWAVVALAVVALAGLAWGVYARWQTRDEGRA